MDKIEQEDNSSDKYYQVIGEIIALRRKAIKITQQDLANAASLSRVHISNIEGGRCGIPISTLYRIAEGLKTNIHELLPKSIDEIDSCIARVAIHRLAHDIGIDPVEHEEELQEIMKKLSRMKEEKDE